MAAPTVLVQSGQMPTYAVVGFNQWSSAAIAIQLLLGN